jgi:hypothetical protein
VVSNHWALVGENFREDGLMGFNTTVVIMNDSLGAIANDPTFGKSLAEAVVQRKEDVPAYSYVDGKIRGVHCNAATVIESHHADGTAIVAVGGNMGVKLDEVWYVGNIWTEEGKLKIIKQMADNMGYRLVKKREGR